MTRILGIDYGSKKIGIAVSDALGFTAQPLQFIHNKGLEFVNQELANLCQKFDIEMIILGLPLHMNATEGELAFQVREFGKNLESHLKLKILFWDERLTTKMAERILISGDVRRKKRRTIVDCISASILLQSYLDSRSSF